MKKKALLLASMGVLACTVGVTALAFGGSPKLNAIFATKAASKSFTFNAAAGGQFKNDPEIDQVVDVTTGLSDPIQTVFQTGLISSLAFGQNGRFVEAHPIADEPETYYSLVIGINNLTHFEIDMGVANDGGDSGEEDIYEIELRDAEYDIVKDWYSYFELDGNGNGTKHIVWDKGVDDSAVVQVRVNLYFEEDSADASLYINSLSLTWNC